MNAKNKTFDTLKKNELLLINCYLQPYGQKDVYLSNLENWKTTHQIQDFDLILNLAMQSQQLPSDVGQTKYQVDIEENNFLILISPTPNNQTVHCWTNAFMTIAVPQ